MATVYLAEDERLGRRVAVKRLHADSPEDVGQRFAREARLGASLNHPNLVAVFDTVTDDEGVLIIMEYVDGPTLAQALNEGPLPADRAIAMLRGIASALDQAHAQGIIHRDVKPANILLGEAGRAKLADLGIAFAAEHMTQITRTGTVLGTPSYMAPEQLESREIGPEVDVYALGAVAFEALSGRKARTGATPVEIAHRIANEPAPELREAWPEAPAGAAEALCAAMSADPAERPRSAGTLVEWLAAALEGYKVPTEATRRMGEDPGRGRAGAGAALGAAGAAAGLGAAGARDDGDAGGREVAEGAGDEPEVAAERGRVGRGESAGPKPDARSDLDGPPAEAGPPEDDKRAADHDAFTAPEPRAEHGPAGARSADGDTGGDGVGGAGVAGGAAAGAAAGASAHDAGSAHADAAARENEDVVSGPSAAASEDSAHAESDLSSPHENEAAARDGQAQPPFTSGRRRRPAWLAPLALIAAPGVIAAIVVLTAGGGGGHGSEATSGRDTARFGGEGMSSGAANQAPQGAKGDPAATVKAFYTRAAADDYAGAWALAGPPFRTQLGGFGSFRGGMSRLQSIDFRRAETVSQTGDSAQVAVDTVAKHTNRVDRCRGTLDLARAGKTGWVIDHANIACTNGRGGAAAALGPAGTATTGPNGSTATGSGASATVAGGSAATARASSEKVEKGGGKGQGGARQSTSAQNGSGQGTDEAGE